MKITFLGAAREVGRSCFLLEEGKKKILLDCGINLGSPLAEERFPVKIIKKAKQINGIIVSHAHLDHTGYIPFLVQAGFHGKIYCTKPTRDLMQLLLSDALKIAKEQKVEKHYAHEHIMKTLELIELMEFGEEQEIVKGVKLKFYNAGHIPGSAMALVKTKKGNVLYTGDFNTRETHLLKGAKVPEEKIHTLIMESTYCGKQDVHPSLQRVGKELVEIVRTTFARGGNVLIPAFAVGRGQEIMLALENYIRSGYMPAGTVFIDGMIARANRIARHNVLHLKEEIPRRILLADSDPFKSPYMKTPKTKHKRDVVETPTSVILATSGMLSAGPSVRYFKLMAPEPKHTIVLAGFQAQGTNGRALLDGEREIVLKDNRHPVKVECDVKRVHFSGHADYKGLLEFARAVKPKNVFLVHGEKEKAMEFATELHKQIKCKAVAPELKQEIKII